MGVSKKPEETSGSGEETVVNAGEMEERYIETEEIAPNTCDEPQILANDLENCQPYDEQR
ncbi:9818_t:CDS:2 [Diversispora eburnea]|uniref:9818_t:CDS:1 n=1 Tax=Diversispora eburnea TaxID=1213867 RepID=A0A9N9A660_9GLOM|nr:9818_t:CDS:2 [Diversispora eburnea]